MPPALPVKSCGRLSLRLSLLARRFHVFALFFIVGSYDVGEMEKIVKDLFVQDRGSKIENGELVQLFKEASFDTSDY